MLTTSYTDENQVLKDLMKRKDAEQKSKESECASDSVCKLISLALCTVGPVLTAWFNYYVLTFASKIANLLIVFASHEARKVCYK